MQKTFKLGLPSEINFGQINTYISGSRIISAKLLCSPKGVIIEEDVYSKCMMDLDDAHEVSKSEMNDWMKDNMGKTGYIKNYC